MVGGGRGGFIGGVHRLGARRDGQYELVAGALSSDPERAKESGAELGLARDRVYTNFADMAAAEAHRAGGDGIEVVSIVTPNDSHHAIARAFLDRGIDVICDKPMTTTVADALDLVQTVQRTGLVFGVTHNYTGYPMVRQARGMVAAAGGGEWRGGGAGRDPGRQRGIRAGLAHHQGRGHGSEAGRVARRSEPRSS